LVLPVVDRRPGSASVTRWSSAGRELGSVRHRIGPRGASPAPGALLPVTLSGELPPGRTDLVAIATGGEAVVDAVMLEPLVSRYVIGAAGKTTALLRSAARTPQTVSVTGTVPGVAVVETYDAAGELRARVAASGRTIRATVLPGGFTVVRHVVPPHSSTKRHT
jgi:hypothetical protein